jgi:hypothetical protein
MSDVKVYYDEVSDPETINAEEIVLGEKEYIIRQFDNNRVIIPRENVQKIEFDESFVEVAQEA